MDEEGVRLKKSAWVRLAGIEEAGVFFSVVVVVDGVEGFPKNDDFFSSFVGGSFLTSSSFFGSGFAGAFVSAAAFTFADGIAGGGGCLPRYCRRPSMLVSNIAPVFQLGKMNPTSTPSHTIPP